jgi:hypothetical protein
VPEHYQQKMTVRLSGVSLHRQPIFTVSQSRLRCMIADLPDRNKGSHHAENQ